MPMLAKRLESLARFFLYVLVFVLPLFFLPIGRDPLEAPKQTLLVVLSLAAALAWTGSALIRKRLVLRQGALAAFAILLAVGQLLTALLSRSPYRSWVGPDNQEYASALTICACLLVFVLVWNLVHTEGARRTIRLLILLSASLCGAIGLLALFGVPILLPFGGQPLLTTVGAFNLLSVYLSAAAAYGCALWLAHDESVPLLGNGRVGWFGRALTLLACAEAFALLVLRTDRLLWGIFLLALLALIVLALVRWQELAHPRRFFLPFVLVAISLPFFFFLPRVGPSAMSGLVEAVPGFSMSMGIAREAIADAPALGSGQGTFDQVYGRFRPIEMNGTGFWSVRFDRGASFALTTLATNGLVGSGIWLLFLLAVLILGIGRYLRAGDRHAWSDALADAVGWIALVLGLAFANAGLTTIFLLFVFSGLLSGYAEPESETIALPAAPKAHLALMAGFLALCVGFATLTVAATLRLSAESSFGRAMVAQAQGPSDAVVTALDRASRLNRFDDAYPRSAAQVLVARGAQEAQAASKNEKPDQAKIQTFTAGAVNAAVRATELAPSDAANWRNRGQTYRNFVALVANAGDFAVQAYERAIELEPTDPFVQNELGLAYVAMAEAVRPIAGAEDKSAASQAQARLADLLQKATAAFNKALALKADYAGAAFQLALMDARSGQVDGAIAKMEALGRANPTDVGVAFQLGLLSLQRAKSGDLARAQQAFEHAVALSPSFADARWFLASAYEQQGKMDLATEQVRKVLELDPKNPLVAARLKRLEAGEKETSASLPSLSDEFHH